jgi:hypothetical protein
MPANSFKGRLNAWLAAFEERHDLNVIKTHPDLVSPEAFDKAWREHLRGLSRAARFFGLDQENPTHRMVLLYILAEVVFYEVPKGRPRGTTKWDKNRLLELAAHADVLRKRTGRVSDKDAAKELKNVFDDEYRHDSPETIRQRLPDASRVRGEFLELLHSRMNELGLSLPEYLELLFKEYTPEQREDALRKLHRAYTPEELETLRTLRALRQGSRKMGDPVE